jgi:uncharacterized protein YcnI
MIRRLVFASAIAAVAALGSAGPALAHIDPDPTDAQAGSRLTVGFTVEHGCEGSPTVQLDMRLPDGVTDALAEPLDDWTGSVELVDGETIVTFVGGPLPDDVEATFDVTMTLPPTPDTTIYFPFVQRCEVGEIRWIGIPAEPGDELDEPAPAMTLTGPVATTVAPETTGPATTEVSSTTALTEPTASSLRPVASEPPATSVTVADSAPSSTEAAADEDEGIDSGAGTIVFIASIAVVLGLGAIVAYRARQNRPPGRDASTN